MKLPKLQSLAEGLGGLAHANMVNTYLKSQGKGKSTTAKEVVSKVKNSGMPHADYIALRDAAVDFKGPIFKDDLIRLCKKAGVDDDEVFDLVGLER